MGREVIILEPSADIGGQALHGLGEVVDQSLPTGGLAAEFYQLIAHHYEDTAAWPRQERYDYQYRYESRTGSDRYQLWSFEPKVARQIFLKWVADEGLQIATLTPIDRQSGIIRDGTKITALRTLTGHTYHGQIFIDASYQGDLLATAGVPHTFHDSGQLTPRLLLTDDPSNRLPFAKPENYQRDDYQKAISQLTDGSPWTNLHTPNNKSYIDFAELGPPITSETYASASDTERAQIREAALRYHAGWLWTLAHDSGVPSRIRHYAARWGLCLDEYSANGGLPSQLLGHPSRSLTKSEPLIAGTTVAIRSESGESSPIHYGALLADASHTSNLITPTCLAGGLLILDQTMAESLLISLGQAAGTASALALDHDTTLHTLPYTALKTRLVADDLHLTAPPIPLLSKRIEGIVLDETQAELLGPWAAGHIEHRGVNHSYLHDGSAPYEEHRAIYTAELPRAGEYEVQISYPALPTRATQVPVEIEHASGKNIVQVNQQKRPEIAEIFTSVGRYHFDQTGCVTISNALADGSVVIDAVRWVPVY